MTNDKSNIKIGFFESTRFLFLITWVGGYIDAYTYIVRGGVFANNHTGNVCNLGIAIANLNWCKAAQCLVPIVSTILGATFSCLCKVVIERHHNKGDWRKIALSLELFVLFIVGFIPTSISNLIVNGLISFVTGFQLCLFRSWWGNAHNTTICTGNLRALGQYFYQFICERNNFTRKMVIYYSFLIFAFIFGNMVCAYICSKFLFVRSVWIACIVLIVMIFIMNIKGQNNIILN